MMKVNDFLKILTGVTTVETLYVKGGIGRPLNKKNKELVKKAYAYNRRSDRAAKIDAASDHCFSFDCIGLVKSVLWGFKFDVSAPLGGATYISNNVPDVTELAMLKLCTEVSSNMNNIEPGEFLWLSGHCGVYIGSGEVVESSPIWKDGVQITKLSMRKWAKHGKLPFVEYNKTTSKPPIARPTLRNGSKGIQVEYLQRDLNYLGATLEVDGKFGPLTAKAVMDFQKKNNIQVDGVYGAESHKTMKGVMV